MAGVVLETLSWKKLIILGTFLFGIVLVFCIIGGVVAPGRTGSLYVVATFCVDETRGAGFRVWFVPRGAGNCTRVDTLDAEEEYNGGISDHQIVVATWLPYGRQLDFSRWQKWMVATLELSVLDSEDVPLGKEAKVTIEGRIGYRDKGGNHRDWKELYRSREQRELRCEEQGHLNDTEGDTRHVCTVFSFFELASLHHDYYLLNFRVPVRPFEDMNLHIGKLRDITLTAVYQNGLYTKLLLFLKTLVFPLMLMALAWYWRRVLQQTRAALLLEKTIFALGIALSLLNCPIEWFTLVADIPAMSLINEARQAVFIGFLYCFGIIFVGEHLCEWSDGNFLTDYWKRLFAIFTGTFLYILFKVCERGVTIANAFDNIWMADVGFKVSMSFLVVLAGVLPLVYFLYLCFISVKLVRYTNKKDKYRTRRAFCVGLKVVLLSTLVVVAATLAFLLMSAAWDAQWTWGYGRARLEHTAAFWFGFYGLINAHVLGIMSLFAPSHKPQRPSEEGSYGLVSDIAEGEAQT